MSFKYHVLHAFKMVLIIVDYSIVDYLFFFQYRVIGMHVVGPNAGEMIQGFALAFKTGATKEHFDDLIGIHPTNAEVSGFFSGYQNAALNFT